jgi:hypothetical protein
MPEYADEYADGSKVVHTEEARMQIVYQPTLQHLVSLPDDSEALLVRLFPEPNSEAVICFDIKPQTRLELFAQAEAEGFQPDDNPRMMPWDLLIYLLPGD